MDSVVAITLLRKGNLQLCQNYRTKSLISHLSKVMLKVILNILKPHQHQQILYHVFKDFKKALDRVWYAALWATMPNYNINASLVRAIEHLFDNTISAVQMNGSKGEWFRTTLGIRQVCLLSPSSSTFF